MEVVALVQWVFCSVPWAENGACVNHINITHTSFGKNYICLPIKNLSLFFMVHQSKQSNKSSQKEKRKAPLKTCFTFFLNKLSLHIWKCMKIKMNKYIFYAFDKNIY